MPDITRGPNGVARIAPVGSAGPAGRDGVDGTDGADGNNGADGLPGVNAVANDTATASYISTPSSATATALSTSFASLKTWDGLKVCTYGDSRASTDYPWFAAQVRAKTGATVTVDGHSGASVEAQTNNAWLDEVVAAAPDLIVILCEGNDPGNAGTVGTFAAAPGETVVTDPDPTAPYAGTKFIEAVAYIVRYLNSKLYARGTKIVLFNGLPQHRYDHSTTGLFNNPLNHQRKAEAIREVCDRYHVDMIDSLRQCGWDMLSEPFWPGVTDKNTNLGIKTMDGLHPNELGDDILTDLLVSLMHFILKPTRYTNLTPGQVTGLTTGAPTTTTMPLSWTAATRAASYLVEKRLDSGSWSVAGTTAATSLTATGLTAASAYTFRVTGVNSAGIGTASATVTATTLTTPAPSFTDNFNRPDQHPLGTASGGGTWPNDPVFGITSNRATIDGGQNNAIIYVTGGSADYQTVQGTYAGGEGLLARASGASGATSKGWFAYPNGGDGTKWTLFRLNNGGYSEYAPASAPTATAGDVVKLVCDASSVKLYVNNVLLVTANSAFNATSTSAGLWGSGGGAGWDDFSVS